MEIGKRLIIATVAAAAMIASFAAGVVWAKHSSLASAYELTQPLSLTGPTGAAGTLPAGSVLYTHDYSGETATFKVFVNTNRLELLAPKEFDHWLTVSPIEAHQP